MDYELTLKPNQRKRVLRAFKRIPSDILSEFTRSVDRWVGQSGPDWTVSRLKSVKQDLIRFAADGTKPSTPWVAKTRRGNFRGVLGTLQHYAVRSELWFREVLQLIQIYTMYIHKDLTSKDEAKFRDALSSDPDWETPDEYMLLIESAVRHRYPHKVTPGDIQPFTHATHRYGKELITQYLQFRNSTRGALFEVYFEDIIPPLIHPDECWGPVTNRIGSIGDVHVHLQGGLKARFYAAPELWVQWLLRPLGTSLFSQLKTLPWDCTHEQGKAFPTVQRALAKGQTIHGFDLSSATDRFPFDLQLKALTTLISNNRMVGMYAYLATSPFRFLGDPDDTLQWVKGQPLGTFPSFAAFAFTHGMLIYGLNGHKWNEDFFVLGDDVIILNDELAERYETALQDLDVPWNPSKTLRSANMAEFAGKVVTPNRVIQAPKWKPWLQRSVCNLGQIWGDIIRRAYWGKDRPLVEWWLSLPEPYGAGINPDGIPLSERMMGLEHLFSRETDDKIGYHISVHRLGVQRMIHAVNTIGEHLYPYILQQVAALRWYDQYQVETILDEIAFADILTGDDLWQLSHEFPIPLMEIEKKSWKTDYVSRKYLQLLRDTFNAHMAACNGS